MCLRLLRTDNLSAATHELKGKRRSCAERAVCGGTGALRAAVYEDEPEVIPRERQWPSRVTTGSRGALGQALVLRGSRDIGSVEAYLSFVRQVADKRNRLVWGEAGA